MEIEVTLIPAPRNSLRDPAVQAEYYEHLQGKVRTARLQSITVNRLLSCLPSGRTIHTQVQLSRRLGAR